MTLSVVIVSWNTNELLKKCLTSLLKELGQVGEDTEVIVVDNNSADGSAVMVAKNFPAVKLIANKENLGFGKGCNQGIRGAGGEYILFLNPDTEVLPKSIFDLLQFARNISNLGIVAPQLLNADRSVQRSCRAFPTISGMFFELAGMSRLFPRVQKFRTYKMLDFDHNITRQVDQPEGACLLIPKKVLERVGVFDEKFFMLFEEVDLCYRIKKAGYEIWFYPESKIIHHYGQSIKQVKAKMIISSHKGMFYYWSKHHREWYHQMVKPLLWLMLAGLGGLRIVIYKIRNIS